MVDIARLGLAVDSSQVEKGTVTLNQLTGAAGAAERATRGLASGANAEAVAQRTATAATAAHTAALSTQNAIMRSNAAQRTMMIFQLNDIAVSLASGMNPAMVAMQQGSQILQGGLMPAIRTLIDLGKGFVTTFWPVAAVVGAAAVGFAALTTEINRTAETQVSMTDVMLASWQLLSEQIVGFFQPVLDFFGGLWSAVSPHIASAINGIIGLFDLGFKDVKTIWSMLPAALGDSTIQTLNTMMDAIEDFLNQNRMKIAAFMLQVAPALGPFGGQMASAGGRLAAAPVTFDRLENQFGGAEEAFYQQMGQNRLDVMTTDYVGLIGSRAQSIAIARKETEEAGSAAEAANQKFKKLAEDGLTSVAERADAVVKGLTDAFKGIASGLFGILKEGGDIATKALDLVLSKLEQFAMSWLDNIVNTGLDSLFGSLFGGRGFGTGLFGVSSVTPLGFGGTAGIYPGFANGTSSAPGGLAWVGERGPELMQVPRGARIYNAQQSAQIAANSNTPSIKNELHIHPPAGFNTRTEESETEGGMRTDVFFDRAVAGAINRPGSQSARAASQIGRVVRR